MMHRKVPMFRFASFTLLCVYVLTCGASPTRNVQASDQRATLSQLAGSHQKGINSATHDSPRTNHLTYLPLLVNPDRIFQDSPIWAHAGQPKNHEVALFRLTFSQTESLSQAELHIFADTRYEVWIDGIWKGRGPARFSSNLREYDVHPIGALDPGVHLIAVLVQWAPNTRRAESTRPHLRGHIQSGTNTRPLFATRTSADWKTFQTTAWRTDSAPVHAWGLIGPTELLDFRQLPDAWNQPGFNDTAWLKAQVVEASTTPTSNPTSSSTENVIANPANSNGEITYQPRSIPLPVAVPVRSSLVDAGLLSPGSIVGEITPPFTQPVELPFSALQATDFTIETLLTPGVPTDSIRVDGSSLTWNKIGANRWDVIKASLQLGSGKHRLTFDNIPATGLTFQFSKQNIQYSSIPFSQGVHAGRRLLLANYARDLSKVKITTEPALGLEFDKQPVYAVLDLGRTIHGRLEAQVSGPVGTIIDIGWDERLFPANSRPLPYPGSLHAEWNQVDSWVLDGSIRDLSTIDSRAGRYILIAVWGAGVVKLSEITVYEERFPVTQSGYFYSSDPLLDRIWQVGVDTLYPNMVDAYSDTPWRERGQWWGDAYIADHTNRVALGDTQILKRSLIYVADAFAQTGAPGIAPNTNGTHMLDYAMLWVASLAEYVQISGDDTILDSVYEPLTQFVLHLGSFENRATGLLDLPKGPWAQTAYVESRGSDSRYGQSTALNALYYSTLLHAADLADQADKPGDAQTWRQKATLVKQKINELLYLPVEQRYATTIYQGVTYPPTPHAQAWALAYGLVPESSRDAVVSALLDTISTDPASPNLDIYGMYWVLEALGQAGDIEPALALIESYYGRLLDSNATTWWEQFTSGNHYWQSLSHTWGGSPTWFLSTYILGARWTGPRAWQIRPPTNVVDVVAGSIPLQNGSLQVRWERRSCQASELVIISAPDTRGEVVLPLTASISQVTLDGKAIFQYGVLQTTTAARSPDELRVQVNGGQHSMTIRFDC
jgi:alpha-L-rhamnosidase